MNTPLVKEIFILKINKENLHKRIYDSELIKQWIKELPNSPLKGYKIEYGVRLDERNLKVDYIKDALYCGLLTDFKIDAEDNLTGIVKFKSKGQYAQIINEKSDFFNDLVLVPKGKGKTLDNKVFDYDLIGFSLITSNASPFLNIESKEV